MVYKMSLLIFPYDRSEIESVELIPEGHIDELLERFKEEGYSERVGTFIYDMQILGDLNASKLFALIAVDHERNNLDVENIRSGHLEVDLGVLIFADSEEKAIDLFRVHIMNPRFMKHLKEMKPGDDWGDYDENVDIIMGAMCEMRSDPINYIFSQPLFVNLDYLLGDWIQLSDEHTERIRFEIINRAHILEEVIPIEPLQQLAFEYANMRF